MDNKELEKEYADLIRFLQYSLKELPKCVLYGLDCADHKECEDLLKDADRLEKISEKLGIDNIKFIEVCRWHYNSYPVFLDNQSEYKSYEAYIIKHDAPTIVE